MISLDGIYKQKRKKVNKRKPTRSSGLFTVSARVKEKKEASRRKMTSIVVLLLLLSGVGWTISAASAYMMRSVFSENPKYTIKHWDLSSNGILTPAHIRQYGQLPDSGNLFAIDLKAVRLRLESAANVRVAHVQRRLPDTLYVRVEERMAIARLGRDRASLAVDHDGYVLGPGSVRPQLPVIEGVRQAGLRPGMILDSSSFQDALTFLTWCERADVSAVIRPDSIHLSDPENLDIRLKEGERVLITRAHLDQRIQELIPLLEQRRANNAVASLIKMTGDPDIPPVSED